jgi:peroxiredoxin
VEGQKSKVKNQKQTTVFRRSYNLRRTSPTACALFCVNLQFKNGFMKIATGQEAPAFSLVDTEKNKVSLADRKGKNVLLLFFPLAFTGVCSKELCLVRDNIAVYNNANAQVFGISVDAPPTLAKFKADQGINFPLLSDFNREASAAYGALYEAFAGWMKGVSKRSAFIVDGDGVVRYAEVLENASELPDFEEIQRVLQALNQG